VYKILYVFYKFLTTQTITFTWTLIFQYRKSNDDFEFYNGFVRNAILDHFLTMLILIESKTAKTRPRKAARSWTLTYTPRTSQGASFPDSCFFSWECGVGPFLDFFGGCMSYWRPSPWFGLPSIPSIETARCSQGLWRSSSSSTQATSLRATRTSTTWQRTSVLSHTSQKSLRPKMEIV
jgi:hypothetical protein